MQSNLKEHEMTITFALRTDDTAWIARNHGVTSRDGKTYVEVPADEVEQFTRLGKPWLRHVFADVPSDALNAAISCPAIWVPESATILAGP
jgi:hypothetical protein